MALTGANLISYWGLGEASGTRADSVVASANDLTPNGPVSNNPGKQGNAAQITATTQYLSKADNASLSTGDIDFTLACWCYFDSLGANRTLISKYNTTGNQREHLLFYNHNDHVTNQRFSFAVSSNGTAVTSRDATTFGAPTTATWYFVIAWHDSVANTINISINDTGVDSTSYSSGVFDSTAAFQIGMLMTATYPMDGRVDEAAFWKGVPTTADITDLYNSGNGRDYTYVAAMGAAGQPTMRRGGLIDYIAQPLEIGRSNVRVI